MRTAKERVKNLAIALKADCCKRATAKWVIYRSFINIS